jgi:ankyrin repeat protein
MNAVAENAKRARDRETEFLKAASLGDLDVVRRCVAEEGVSTSCVDSRRAGALHLAACRGHTAVLAFMTSHGADVDAEDEQGRTGA